VAAPAPRVRISAAERWGKIVDTGIVCLGRRDALVPLDGVNEDADRRVLKYATKAGLLPQAPAFAHYSIAVLASVARRQLLRLRSASIPAPGALSRRCWVRSFISRHCHHGQDRA
jgi:hypothetical protein